MQPFAEFLPKNPNYQQEVERVLTAAPFIQFLGLQAEKIEPGLCYTKLKVREDLQQQDGFVHAGVQATICDHTAGTAGATLIAEGKKVLTAEFKINLLRPGAGKYLVCQSAVLKPGNTLIIAESMLFALPEENSDEEEWNLIAKATVTLAVV